MTVRFNGWCDELASLEGGIRPGKGARQAGGELPDGPRAWGLGRVVTVQDEIARE